MHQLEARLLKAVLDFGKVTASADEIASLAGLEKDHVYRGMAWLEEKGVCSASRNKKKTVIIDGETRLPEIELVKMILKSNDKQLAIGVLEGDIKSFGLQWAKKNGWVEIEDGIVRLSDGFDSEKLEAYDVKKALENRGRKIDFDELGKELCSILVKRGMARVETNTKTYYKIDFDAAHKLWKEQDGNNATNGIGFLDSKIIAEKSWESRGFTGFEVTTAVGAANGARKHTVSRLSDKIRSVFLSMGFEEMSGDIIELSMWNFDALFQPQDHPVRELADTFYFEEKDDFHKYIDKSAAEKIKAQQETCWKYKWSEDEANRLVLRTHTTCLSARQLYKLASLPMDKRKGKFFAVGKVFRNEATDFKHLAEFYQVEGIIVWKNADFRHLLGILTEFYSRIGFDKVRFRPSYFPYTEPSLEIEVFFKDRNEWMELGGAGIFRPEVSIPLCGIYPVLAWGLSLERPLMLVNKIDDIRSFYTNDLGWMRGLRK